VTVETNPAATRRIRLTYADTDAAGILYFAAWFPWMERLSVEWVYDKGFRFDQMRERFGAAPVARATTCDYTGPTHVYDEIEMAMRVDHVGTSSYRLAFTMTRLPEAAVVARSTLTLVCVGPDGRPRAIPDAYRSMLQEAR
jgi:acyl-CoA thioester hydrolase